MYIKVLTSYTKTHIYKVKHYYVNIKRRDTLISVYDLIPKNPTLPSLSLPSIFSISQSTKVNSENYDILNYLLL